MLFKLCLIYMFCPEVFAELLQGQLLSNSRPSHTVVTQSHFMLTAAYQSAEKGKGFQKRRKVLGAVA
ncbi:hypothetical protein EXN66_Car013937 [Channa argus]|uniref:Secreted protein n=1 Tax=Channa argus TaxID=215402 RepID=A0A6G1Q7W8_CHAAH|nr:hypothetical protein EXN66_Car013937 [Channa argus]